MKLNRKLIESGIVAVAFMLITAGAFLGGNTTESKVQSDKAVRAGIVAVTALDNEDNETEPATIEKTKTEVVTSADETAMDVSLMRVQTQEKNRTSVNTEKNSKWENCVMADVKDSLNIRKKANSRSKLVGKLYKGGVATILETKGQWVKIHSGNVTGYVKSEYCVFNEKAEKLAKKLGTYYVISKADGLRVRAKASEESEVYTIVDKGSRFKLKKNSRNMEEWVAITYDGRTAYVSAEYTKTKLVLGKALSIKEIEKLERQQEETTQEENKSNDSSDSTPTIEQKDPISASIDDVTLLGAIIQCEAGGESYQGKLAVGAVVMNRVRSSSFPDTVSGVIYAPGQFGPASSGKLARQLNSGVSGSCLDAAREALGGADNVDGALYFRNKRCGRDGIIIGNHVFF
ncbi:MAG: cell wall hydrolase [Lachnospiraceae bacterium]